VEHLVVRLREDAAPAQWAIFDDDGRVMRQAQTGPLAEAGELAAGRRVVVLVPGVEVILTETTLPKASPARLRKLVPFSLEDALADDIEQLAFAVGRRAESGAVAVAVVARARLDEWLEQLSAAGLAPQAVYSEADGVPDTPSTLNLVIEGDRIYGRAPGSAAFVFEGLDLAQVLDVVDGDGELKHAVVYVDEAGRLQHADALRALGERIESTQVKLMGDGPLYRLGATLVAEPGTNLLQGEYAPKSNLAPLLQPWRAAAGLLLGLVLVSVAAQAAEYLSLRQQSQALAATLTEVCRRDFSVSLDACDRVVRQRLADAGVARSGTSFLAALLAIAEARSPESRIGGLQYRSGRTTIEIVGADASGLEAFRTAALGSGVFSDVTIRSVSGSGGAARVELIEHGAQR